LSQETGLDRVIEAVLSVGLLLSASLLAGGLFFGSQEALRWGALLLMMTPVARVVVVTVGMTLERDWVFAAVSLWILAVLVWSAWSAVRS
jgi:uncharacterized membrane protein